MAEEIPITTAVFVPSPPEEAPPPEAPKFDQEPTPAQPSPEEARAVEVVFAQEENRLVGGLIGLWSGALILHDIAVDTFSPPANEDEDEPDPRNKEEDDPAD
jgi:hypothetical protein